MKVTLIKMALNTVIALLKQIAPLTSNEVDDKIIREFERIKNQVIGVLS